jgi:5,10-methylenetetrahydromethanopterin reductase
MKLSVIFPETRSVFRAAERAQQAEDAGLHGMFLGSAFGFDPMMALGYAGTKTSTILLGTAVVPTWPRHPVVMAQSAATANQMCGGRFRLGIGPSHKPVMKMYGIDFDRPISHLAEYVDIVKTLLSTGTVQHKGDRFKVRGFLDVKDGGNPPVLLSALKEQACRLAGRVADGVLPWLTPPVYVREVIEPNVAAGAAVAGRSEAPPIIAECPAVLETDFDRVREVVTTDLAVYPQMPFYGDIFVRIGAAPSVEEAAKGWTDDMINAVVPWGDRDVLAARAQEYFDAGADEVAYSLHGGDADKNLEVLGDIARS